MELAFNSSSGTPTDPTVPDTEFSIDGGKTFSDCTEEIETGGTNGVGYLTLTGAETNNPMLAIAGKSSNCLTARGLLHPRGLAIVGSGTLSAGSAGGGTLGTLLAYDVTGCFIRTTGGTGGGGTGGANNQARRIITYNTTTGAFTITNNWETTPDATTTYDVLLPEGVTLGMLRTLNPATPGRTAVVDSQGLMDANTVKIGPSGGGTAQTAGDVVDKASSLLLYPQRTVIRGTVGSTNLTTSTFTVSALDIAGIDLNQFAGRVIIFDVATTTTGLRGQGTAISGSTIATLPTFTFNTLTRAPAAGDLFSIV
jgi:hypothetical protein